MWGKSHPSALLLLALLACGAREPAHVTVPGAAEHPLAPAPRKTRLGEIVWWKAFDVPALGFSILPRPDGGATVYAVHVEGGEKGPSASGASARSFDAAGRTSDEPLVIEGTQASGMDREASGDFAFAATVSGSARVGGTTFRVRYGLVVAKLGPRGEMLWSTTFEGASFSSLAAMPGGGVVVTGTLTHGSVVDFGGGAVGQAAWPSPVFLAAFDAQGRHVFSRAFDVQDLYGRNLVAVDGAGEITLVCAGRGEERPDFGGGPLHQPKPPQTFVARFDARGSHLWSTSVPLELSGAEVGRGGEVIVSGTAPRAKPYEREMVVVRLDRAGHESWRRAFGLEQYRGDVVAAALDAAGDALLAVPQASHTATDLMLLDAAGKRLFVQTLDGFAVIGSIAFGRDGSAFVGGRGGPKLSYGRRVLSFEGPGLEHGGAFVMKLFGP